ncbi:MAG: RidA family protein [Janthinobacterium lividum]
MRKLISSGAPWEATVGYSRAVRVGQVVEVAGTTAQDGDTIIGSDEYTQTKRILEKISAALHEAGATLEQVVRTRIFVTNIANWEAVGRAHGEVFSQIRPASTMVQVAALIDPRLLVEIEATAIIE